jgi:hypothetical protein
VTHDVVTDGSIAAFDPKLMELTNWDDLNWLNTIDWTQGDWLDMNQSLP